jgi:hypothetical protein
MRAEAMDAGVTWRRKIMRIRVLPGSSTTHAAANDARMRRRASKRRGENP